MPRMTVYLDDEAYAFVKEKTPGYIGRLVKEKMGPERSIIAGIPGFKPAPVYDEPFEEAP